MLEIVTRSWLIVLPLFAVLSSYVIAFLLRFEFSIPENVELDFRIGLGIFPLAKILVFRIFRLHTSRWRLAGLHDLFTLAIANVTASALICATTILWVSPSFPRSVYFIDLALCFLATAGIPFSIRLYWEVLVPNASPCPNRKSVFIYGAGAAGSLLCKELRSNLKLETRVAGFLDDDEAKLGSCIDGVPVIGTGSEAARLVAQFASKGTQVSEIIIALPSASALQMRKAVDHCSVTGIPFKTLPGVAELLSGKISSQIREVQANDLLGREPVRIEESRIASAITNETVLVTGGCGSIGSELCRQLAGFNPGKLVIFDQAESEMFMLALELRKRFPRLELVTEVGDICRAGRVRGVMSRHAINVVFHAAAYKHVPLMEENICEAIENNVIGTYNVVQAAHRAGVSNFVLISSDKAVNPTSIMGLTKRVAELIVSATPLDGGTKTGAFVSVRFGNVLGSAGSVIPIFRRQIAAGGPVTVTHPDMHRYFMSVSEAVQLVLQASTMGEGSEVFVLDMGDPVRIMDLAQNMIRLAGLRPEKDIEIRVTGLRPGEKLFEELKLDGEHVLPTHHEKIRRFRLETPDPLYLRRWLERLRILLMEGNSQGLKTHLLLLVPEYQGSPVATVNQDPPALVRAHAS